METAHLYAVNVLGDRYEIDRPGPDQAVQSCRVGGKFDVRWLSLQNMKRIGMSAKRPVLLGNSFAAEFPECAKNTKKSGHRRLCRVWCSRVSPPLSNQYSLHHLHHRHRV
jgi:hypothetical protein